MDYELPKRPHRSGLDGRTVALPIVLLVLLLALGAWRAGDAPDAAGPVGARLVPRSFGDLAVDTPEDWRVLDRTARHVTWGAPDRSHTVTLASTEASAVALPVVVREVAAGSGSSIPGARLVSGPVELELDERAARGDSAVLVEFAVPTQRGRALSVVQVWRRDARVGVDAVATWTSADGRWPASPRSAIPHVSGSR